MEFIWLSEGGGFWRMLSFSNFVRAIDDYFFLLEDFFLLSGGRNILLLDSSMDSTVWEMLTEGGLREETTEYL